jgi:5-formyltetrahydrofolate cyclo-ligase
LPEDGADAKRRLRSAIVERRRRVSAVAAAEAAAAVARAALEEPRVRRAHRIALYAAFDGELPTRDLFEALGALPAVRILPRVGVGGLTWARAIAWGDLSPGRFGIREPVSGESESLDACDIAFVPGVAFDADGWRLGRGGGYYDRAFVPGKDRPWVVGVGYSFQWVAEVPHDSRDRRVDAIVTEHGWVWRRRELK